jgi:DNA-binding beta-propeller fold protein YncE
MHAPPPTQLRKPSRPAPDSPRRRAAQLGLYGLLWWLTATTCPAAETNTLSWPPPPAEPYIVYVRDICGPKDIGVRASFFSRLGNALTGVGKDAKRMDRPFGLTLDAENNLVVTDTGTSAVDYLDLSAKKWLHFTSAGGKSFVSPVAAVHQAKTFIVADSAAGCVVGFDEQGKVQFTITNELERPSGLAILGDRLLIADSQLHQVVLCDRAGKFIAKFGRRGQGDGEFNFPTHVAVDDRKQIYVTDSLNHRIQVFDDAGKFIRRFGSVGDGPGHFSRPKGVAVDRAGHVYVVDAVFNNVQIFNGQGRLLLDFSGPGSEAGKLCLPNAIAINSRNEIFVADAYNHRIQVFRYTGRE